MGWIALSYWMTPTSTAIVSPPHWVRTRHTSKVCPASSECCSTCFSCQIRRTSWSISGGRRPNSQRWCRIESKANPPRFHRSQPQLANPHGKARCSPPETVQDMLRESTDSIFPVLSPPHRAGHESLEFPEIRSTPVANSAAVDAATWATFRVTFMAWAAQFWTLPLPQFQPVML